LNGHELDRLQAHKVEKRNTGEYEMGRLRKMSKQLLPGWAGLAAIFVAACVSTGGVEANTLEESGTFGGMRVNYRVVLPDGYDPARAYPAILAFTGGSQNESAVNTHLERFWTEQAEQRGYIVVSPAAPSGGLYFQGGDRIFPEFLDLILETYNIEDGKFHVAGASNGGRSAFHVAASHPEYFKSITGLPGYLPQASTARIAAIQGMCIYMHVGENDPSWLRAMQNQSEQFERNDLQVRFQIAAGQGHFVRSLSGAGATRLFDQIEEAAEGCG
jgi:poly(3-hydroxybutyrate) depolymerase